MIEGKALRQLARRSIRQRDLPIVIRRVPWMNWFAAVFLPLIFTFALLLIWFVLTSAGQLGLGSLFPAVIGVTMLIACYTGVDGIGYHLIIDQEGITTKGRLATTFFAWDEVTHFGTWRMRAFTGDGFFSIGYQAVIYVDGSNNTKRRLQNLFFLGYFIPPKMELGGMELVKLLTKAKRKLEGDHSALPQDGPDGSTGFH